jgi:hypothetical protein
MALLHSGALVDKNLHGLYKFIPVDLDNDFTYCRDSDNIYRSTARSSDY